MQNTDAKQTPHNLQKLIVLGAGDLTLKSLKAWSAKQVILVDASGDVCDQLNSLAQGLEEETEFSVQNIAIADKQETRTFQHLNLTELSGLNLPTGLKKLYPGLKTIESQSMQTQSLQDFLANQDLACDVNSKNGLIIDIPTQLDELLNALIESEFLNCFKEIKFSASSMPLHKDVQSIEYWLNQFQAEGFELQAQSNLNDDFINYTMVKNPLFDQLQIYKQQTAQQIVNLKQQCDQITVERDTARKENGTLKQSNQQASEQNKKLIEENKHLQEEINQINALLEQLNEGFEKLETLLS